jgi:hypothetical protein
MPSGALAVAWSLAGTLILAHWLVGPTVAAESEPGAERSQQAGLVPSGRAGVELAQATRDGRGDLTPNQLTDGRTLNREEALAACGPAAAVAFARAVGREVTLDAAVALAREVGWTPSRGMAGPSSQVALLKRLKIAATLEAGVDRAKVVREVQAGRPVIVRTGGDPGHYLVAERYEPASGKFDFGASAAVLREAGGSRWFGLEEIRSLGVGPPTHAIYLDNTLSALTRPAVLPTAPARPVGATGTAATVATTTTRVVDAGGTGARLRAEPSTDAAIVTVLEEGARVADLSAETAAGGRTWRRVKLADGSAGWVDASLLK